MKATGRQVDDRQHLTASCQSEAILGVSQVLMARRQSAVRPQLEGEEPVLTGAVSRTF